MAHMKRAVPKALPLGDTTVDGLLSGIGAGVIMAVFLILCGLLAGTHPLVTLSAFADGNRASALTGGIVQLAVAGVYGALFGLLAAVGSRRWHLAAPRAWVAGTVYGLALLVIARLVIMPGAPALNRIPLIPMVVAHIIYGLALGYFFDRSCQA